ncbi:rhoGEF domain-containing protein [Naegleria gruberi]|uniref:RhoGEF domain-containing protein n=1 Tax=Naegleria gruberi TaxID=5762 RepID=D2W0W2_NAEGR|nr:rhoGEF domain-containing protein [Naegleria gruberi]EFC37213.1 rhoGEF domain-containing protein [Naegleria gruberi]|eukprot:XP_002669957.1 rhoGEF domain-containing protein [Naegleria gruberi strain NEG-M]
MPKPKNLAADPEDQQQQDQTPSTPPTTLDETPSNTNETLSEEEQKFPTFKLRSYEALLNQIPRFSVDVDMSEDTTEVGMDENLDNYEFSSDDEESSSLMSEEMKLLRQSERMTRNNEMNRLSVGRISQESNDLMPSPRHRHGGLILKKENAILVNNLKEKMVILKRLIKHEANYLFELDLLREKFIGTLKRSDLINSEEMERLFCYSQLNIIWNVNSELLNQFETFYTTLEHINEQSTVVSPRASTIGQIFMRLTPFLKNYIQYSNQLDTCIVAINNKRLKDSYFKSIVKKLERMCTKLASAERKDSSFTLLQAMKTPLQQFVHYRKALIDLLAISQSSTDECNILNDSLKLIEVVNQTFDQSLKEMKNREKFYEINKKIFKQAETGEVVTIIKPNRVFINEAEVYMTSSENNYLEIRKKRKKKKDNNANAISVTKLDIPNENFFKDEKNKLVVFHFNDSIVICTSTFEAPKPPRNSNRETAAKRKRLKQVASMIDSKKLRFKECIDLESDPVPWIRNIVSPDPPIVSTYDQTGQEIVSRSNSDLSFMFQLITWSRIYTFKFMDESTKTQWMYAIQQSLTEIKVSRKQDLDYPHAKSGGYLEIPQSWVLPSILAIQSYIRSYLVVQKTLRIKKKSRKGNRARLSVIHRINQQDNKLLQNQAFAQSYPKKESITLLKDYEEDVNDSYIVVEEEEEDKHNKPKETIKVVQEVKQDPIVESQPETVVHTTTASTSVEEKVIPIPIQDIPETSTREEEEEKQATETIQETPQPIQLPTREPIQQEVVSTQQVVIEEEVEEELEDESPVTTPEVRKEMVDEIIYEDENGAQFYVRVGDEIVYEDEFGNQVVEIVTQEKFWEIVNAADLMEEEEEMEMASRLTETQQETVLETKNNNIGNENVIAIQNPVVETIESMKIVEEPHVEETPIPTATQQVIELQQEPVSTVQDLQQPLTEPAKDEAPLVSTSNSQPTVVETKQEILPPVESESETSQHIETFTTVEPSPVTTPQPINHQETTPTQPPNTKPIIPTLDILRKTSDVDVQQPPQILQSSQPPSSTPRRSIVALDSPRKKEEEIAPWQKELLNKYKNDGKFKFVTQTAEEKIARASFSDEHLHEQESAMMMTPRSSGFDPNNSAIDPVTAKNLNRQSIRISSDFQNFLKKFKTIEQKANEEQ